MCGDDGVMIKDDDEASKLGIDSRISGTEARKCGRKSIRSGGLVQFPSFMN